MPPQYLSQPAALVRHRVVPALLHRRAKLLELAGHPRPLRLALNHEPALPGHATEVREPEKVGGLGASRPTPVSVRRSKPSRLLLASGGLRGRGAGSGLMGLLLC